MTWAELEKLTLAAMEHAFDKEPPYSTRDLKNLAVVASIAHNNAKPSYNSCYTKQGD